MHLTERLLIHATAIAVATDGGFRALLLRGRLLRTLHEGQIAAASQARARDLRVAPEAKSAETAPAAAAPVD